MTGLKKLEENIERLEKANEETRAVIREAHEAIKTVNLTIKELKAEHDRWSNGIRAEVDTALAKQVELGLAEFKNDIQEATSKAHKSVLDEFDKVSNIMLYGNERGKGTTIVDAWLRKAMREEIQAVGRQVMWSKQDG